MSIISKFNNDHIKSLSKLKEYIKFCEEHSLERSIKYKTANHHIVPKTDYPEYSDFNTNKWNKVILTHKDHYIAHSLLAEALSTRAVIFAWWGMNNKDSKNGRITKPVEIIGSDTYNLLITEAKKQNSILGKETSHFIDNCYNKDIVVTKDKDGVIHRVSTDDERYLSGELVHHTTDTITVRDKDGNTFRVDKEDERYLSGELVGVNKGKDIHNSVSRKKISDTLKNNKVNVGEKNGNFGKFWITSPKYKHKQVTEDAYINEYESLGWVRGRIYETVICPHCGVSGKGQAMKRYHFDNCKDK